MVQAPPRGLDVRHHERQTLPHGFAKWLFGVWVAGAQPTFLAGAVLQLLLMPLTLAGLVRTRRICGDVLIAGYTMRLRRGASDQPLSTRPLPLGFGAIATRVA
jgi:hypothetical protein